MPNAILFAWYFFCLINLYIHVCIGIKILMLDNKRLKQSDTVETLKRVDDSFSFSFLFFFLVFSVFVQGVLDFHLQFIFPWDAQWDPNKTQSQIHSQCRRFNHNQKFSFCWKKKKKKKKENRKGKKNVIYLKTMRFDDKKETNYPSGDLDS